MFLRSDRKPYEVATEAMNFKESSPVTMKQHDNRICKSWPLFLRTWRGCANVAKVFYFVIRWYLKVSWRIHSGYILKEIIPDYVKEYVYWIFYLRC